MSEPVWISRVEVEALHRGMIEVGGGSHGLRDAALLDSALARPQNQHAYGETDHFNLRPAMQKPSPAITRLSMATSARHLVLPSTS